MTSVTATYRSADGLRDAIVVGYGLDSVEALSDARSQAMRALGDPGVQLVAASTPHTILRDLGRPAA